MVAVMRCRHFFAMGLLTFVGCALAQGGPSRDRHAWRSSPVEPTLGVEWKPAQTSLGMDRGAVGMQLASGPRLSLKPRHGGLMLTLRHSF